MRYLVQFAIPILIFVAAVVFATQKRKKAAARSAGGERAGDFGMFLAILIVGAAAAVGIAWVTQSLWSDGP